VLGNRLHALSGFLGGLLRLFSRGAEELPNLLGRALGNLRGGAKTSADGVLAGACGALRTFGRGSHAGCDAVRSALHGLDLLTLLPRLLAALVSFGALGRLDLRLLVFDVCEDGFGLFVGERLQDSRQKLFLLIPNVLLKRLPQLQDLGNELLVILRGVLQLRQELAGLLVVAQRKGAAPRDSRPARARP
jgi:hypothetical protein